MISDDKKTESYKHAIYNLIKETRLDKDLCLCRDWIRSLITDAKQKCII